MSPSNSRGWEFQKDSPLRVETLFPVTTPEPGDGSRRPDPGLRGPHTTLTVHRFVFSQSRCLRFGYPDTTSGRKRTETRRDDRVTCLNFSLVKCSYNI